MPNTITWAMTTEPTNTLNFRIFVSSLIGANTTEEVVFSSSSTNTKENAFQAMLESQEFDDYIQEAQSFIEDRWDEAIPLNRI